MSAPPPRLQWSGMTDKGRVRANNEDAFLALTFDSFEIRYLGKIGEGTLEDSDYVFAVSDGMGGAKSGEFASKIATEKITRLLPKSFKQSALGIEAGAGDVLEELFAHIHAELLRLGRVYEECHNMGATLSLCWFTPSWMHFAHIGDSRIYYLPHDGPMKQITDDHTYVGHLRRTGLANERQARTHPRKNVLNKVLGAGHQFVDPQVGSVGVEPGDRFLICSDGIIDGIWDHALEDYVRTTEIHANASKLVTTAIAEGSRDNCTALVIQVAPAIQIPS